MEYISDTVWEGETQICQSWNDNPHWFWLVRFLTFHRFEMIRMPQRRMVSKTNVITSKAPKPLENMSAVHTILLNSPSTHSVNIHFWFSSKKENYMDNLCCFKFSITDSQVGENKCDKHNTMVKRPLAKWGRPQTCFLKTLTTGLYRLKSLLRLPMAAFSQFTILVFSNFDFEST